MLSVFILNWPSVQFSSIAQSCPTLCNPINRSTPGLPVHHQLPELTQTHVHQVSDAIQSILTEISPGISLEGMMIKLKLQYFGHHMRRVDSLEKTDAGRDWGQEEKGMTEDEMTGWHH